MVPSLWHVPPGIHDLGLASAMLTLEATARGLHVHQMIGILPDRVRELYHVPEGVQPLTGLAIGYLGVSNALPEAYRQRDLAPQAAKTPCGIRLRQPVGHGV